MLKHQCDGRCSADTTNPPSNLPNELRTFKVKFHKFPATPIRPRFIQALQFDRKYGCINSHQMNADESLNRESELSCLRWGSEALTTGILRWDLLWFVYRGWRVAVAGSDWKPSLGTGEKSNPLRPALIRLNNHWGPPLRFAIRIQGRGGPRRPRPQQGLSVHSKEREEKKHHLFRVFTVYCFYRALERKLIFYNFPLSIKEQANSRVFSFQKWWTVRVSLIFITFINDRYDFPLLSQCYEYFTIKGLSIYCRVTEAKCR